MNKRGQFFIIGGVILGIIILSIASVWNASLRQQDVGEKRFQSICQNYRHEVFQVSKYAVETGNKSGEPELIKNFTLQFLDYTKISEPNFRLLYVYGNNNAVFVGNYIGESISVNSENVQNSEVKEINGVDKVNITGKINKLYNISEDEGFYFIALEEKDGERYVCE